MSKANVILTREVADRKLRRMALEIAERNIEVKDYNEIVLQLSEVLKQEPKFIQRFSLEGMEFGFIPNLDNITAGEYIDLDTYLKDEETHINAMAILYRPIVSSIKNDYKILKSKQAKELEAVLETSGVGINQFIQLLEEACLTLKKQLQWNYMDF